MSDLINREKAIDALKAYNGFIRKKDAIKAIVGQTTYDNADRIKYECEKYFEKDNGWLGGLKDSIEAIEDIPSIELERTAKVVEHDASVTAIDGYKYHRSEYLCDVCKKKVISGDVYCSHCGAKLDWSEDE